MKFSLLSAASLATSVAAFGAHNQPPKGEATKTDNFLWTDPFHDHRLANKLKPSCTVEESFEAREFLLHDLYEHDPKGLWNYGDALKGIFSGRPYPGGWDGLDPHMYERPLLLMKYKDVPVAVREWIEQAERSEADDEDDDSDSERSEDKKKGERSEEKKNEDKKAGKGLFAVFDRPADSEQKVTKTVVPAKAAMLRPLDAKRVVIFAPGALYSILPLWVAADASEGCQKSFLNLEDYSPKPRDGGVIAWTTAHTAPNRSKGERAMTFTIKAQTLQAAGGASFSAKEEL